MPGLEIDLNVVPPEPGDLYPIVGMTLLIMLGQQTNLIMIWFGMMADKVQNYKIFVY